MTLKQRQDLCQIGEGLGIGAQVGDGEANDDPCACADHQEVFEGTETGHFETRTPLLKETVFVAWRGENACT